MASTTLFVRHTVADYAAWRKIYNDFDEVRKAMGVKSAGVYQADGNPNDVTIYHEFDSIEAAKALAESSDLRDAMGRGGVVGTPDVWFTHRA